MYQHQSCLFARWAWEAELRRAGRVGTNATVPESTLNKKHLGVCYHAVREAVAARIMRVCHIDGNDNLADCLTKLMAASVKRPHIEKILY